ncbi:nuclear transport factor 2 family protein [Sphingobacterium bovistauri]|uniref:nuclear transport factor 2 family protein n=1 Tax=Sphingobacterium bovistauri TaxID=2781959 RepID=UPI001CE22E9F|nr:nuclear transport factor 2 family protein [Sphingobacterium bovistauri]
MFLSWNVSITYAQDKNVEQEIITLSKNKWQWMAEKNVNVLDSLFHEKSVYVHMSGSWDKAREMDVIRSGSIWYKNAVVHDVSVNIVNNTAVLLNRIDLQAVVRGNEVTNPFVVTEVYVKENEKWKLLSLSFTKILTPN